MAALLRRLVPKVPSSEAFTQTEDLQRPLYEPSPRIGHFAASVNGQLYVYSGRTQRYKQERDTLKTVVEVYDPLTETWTQKATTGDLPLGLYNGACTSIASGQDLYTFGGIDGKTWYNDFYCLKVTRHGIKWSKLPSISLTRKDGCGMVLFDKNKLAVFGGHGPPPSSGAFFTRNNEFTDGRGWNNEFHIYNLDTGVWSSPDMTGPRPPPCAFFSFTSVSENRAVVFGGRQSQGRVNDLYVIDFTTMHWTKIEQGVGEPWPEERSSHAACCLDHGGEHPQILITGGWNKAGKGLTDAWLFNVSSRKWKKLTLPDVTLQRRLDHSTTAITLTYGLVEVIMFGGCPEWPENARNARTDDDYPKISETTIMRFESIEHPTSNSGPSTREWVLVDVATNSQRGTSERLREKMMKIIELKSKEMVNRRENVPSTSYTSTADSASLREALQALQEEKRVFEQRVEEAQRQAHAEQQLREQAETTVRQTLLQSLGDVEESQSQALHSDHETQVHAKPQPLQVQDPEVEGTIQSLHQSVDEAQRQAVYFESQLHVKVQQLHDAETALLQANAQVQQVENKVRAQLVEITQKVQEEATQPVGVEDGYTHENVEVSVSSTHHSLTVDETIRKSDTLSNAIKTLGIHFRDLEQRVEQASTRADMAEVTMRQAQSQVIESQNQAIEAEEKASTEVQTALKYLDYYEEKLDDATKQLQEVRLRAVDAEHRFQQQTEDLMYPVSQVPNLKAGVAMEIRGVEVCAETSLIMTNSRQHFYWRGYGLTINIPDGCLSADVDQCVVDIYVSIAGQYEFPEGSHLVSAVYWFRCEPSCKFTKAISVEIEHCAPLKNSNKLSVVRSHCTQKQLPYTFKKVGGVFAEHSSYAFIELNSFSGYSVTQDDSDEREYCATFFYLEKAELLIEIHFVVVWNIEAHLKNVFKHYKRLGAVKGLDLTVSFESDSITLDIPPEGITVRGWKIEALTPPVVAKKHVDTFKPWRRIPSCQMQAILSDEGATLNPANRIPVLTHKVILKGANEPFNYLTISFVPRSKNSADHSPRVVMPAMSELEQISKKVDSTLSSHNVTTNPIPTLKLLLKELCKISYRWEDIGIFLEIEDGLLKTIKSNEPLNAFGCLREMLRVWLNKVPSPTKWDDVIAAVDTIGHESLALELREKYTSMQENASTQQATHLHPSHN